MKRVNFHLDDEQVKRLRALATHKGMAVAELIRRYIDAGLDKEEKRLKNKGEGKSG